MRKWFAISAVLLFCVLVQAQQAPATDVFLAPLTISASAVTVGAPVNISNNAGYDNQPSFSANSRELFYTSVRNNGPSDIYRYDFNTGLSVPARLTSPESEYSAFPMSANAVAVIRVEADSTQRLWRIPLDASTPTVLFPDIKPVGYFAQAGRRVGFFDDDVILEIAAATLHYNSFNTISHGMMLEAPHRDLVASDFTTEADKTE